MEKMNYGIMSTANITKRFVEGIRASKRGQVVAMASRNLEKAQKKAEELAIPMAFGSYEELVTCDEVQVVYIPTINHMHYENAKLALTHGKHVVVEKPMTLSREETAKLFELAKKNQVFIMEAQKSVFLPVTLAIKEKINQGAIGKVHYAHYTMSYPGVDFDWFYDLKKGGGALYGNAGYVLSHSSFLLDEEILDPTGHGILDDNGVDLASTINYKTESGVLVQAQITTLLNMKNQAVIYGEKGKVVIENFWKAREALILRPGEENEVLSYPIDYEMVYEIDHINECIGKGLRVSPVMSDAHSIKIAEIIDELHEGFRK